MDNEEEPMIPREFCEFAREFDVGFISFVQYSQPVIKIVDFKVTPSKILVFSTTRLPLAMVAFSLSNDKYLQKSKTGLVVGKTIRVQESGDAFLHEIFPKRIVWTDSFSLESPPEHIINRVTFTHQMGQTPNPSDFMMLSKPRDKACNKPHIIPTELFLMFEKIRSPAILATARDENHPHLAPIIWWFSGPCFCFSSTGGSIKNRNMIANKRVSLVAVDGMKKNGRGFMVEGFVVSMEYGILPFIRNLRKFNYALKTKVKSSLLSKDLIKHHIIYSRHPDVNYSIGPAKRVLVKIKPKKIKYWTEDNEVIELKV